MPINMIQLSIIPRYFNSSKWCFLEKILPKNKQIDQ